MFNECFLRGLIEDCSSDLVTINLRAKLEYSTTQRHRIFDRNFCLKQILSMEETYHRIQKFAGVKKHEWPAE